jgi:2TM domain
VTAAGSLRRLPWYKEGMEAAPRTEQELREQAISRLKKKRDFRGHVFIYVAVNAMLVVIWAVTGSGFFWPIFPILGWGIGVAANAWDVYGRKPISEDEIRRETERLQG